jgi:CheY-like chemotaxis protein
MEQRKILIVDDEAEAASLLQKLLERTGKYLVSVENDGTRAMDRVVELKPDMVLLDIVMPHIDGTSIAASIRSHPQLHETPVVFLTGIVPKERSMIHKKLGEFPFIAKPIDLDEVINCIEANFQPAV